MTETDPDDSGIETGMTHEAIGENPPSPPDIAPDLPADAPAEVMVAPPAPPPPAIADDALRHLDPRYVELNRSIGVIVTAVIAAAALVGCLGIPAVAGAPGWLIALLAIGGTAVTVLAGYGFHRWPAIEHPHHSYRVNPRGIEIHHGVWFRSVVNVARSRIQHTDVSQGPLERRYGLATLHIHTAGTQQAEVALPGLEHATALAIRDYLVTGGEDDAV